MSSNVFNTMDDEEDVEQLRLMALKSMTQKREQSSVTRNEWEKSSVEKKRTINGKTQNNLKYTKNNMRKNGSLNANLIVLTNNCDKQPIDSKTNSFTEIKDSKTNDINKGSVGPERFNRWERDDSDDTDEDSDDNIDDCGVSRGATNYDETTNDEIISNLSSNDTNDNTITKISDLNETIVESKHSESAQTIELNNTETYVMSSPVIDDKCERVKTNDKIRLNSNNGVSELSAFERRRLKFGQTIECNSHCGITAITSESSDLSINDTNIKNNNIKSRLDLNYANKRKRTTNHSSNDRHSNKATGSDDRRQSRQRTIQRTNFNDDNDDCDMSSKKRLRSLVVMK
ncbi:putative uncharacterized protein DDB_G0282133 [Oppia nitens]|uniref:putative uncharacterized protein DDB_G0282133 n=1 Tax=Oppia nitens TaxID=1686743 RepID=UPI0023D9A43F|nr:putative uncharacterized protein DDB_G0282133 [Oppia nitens]